MDPALRIVCVDNPYECASRKDAREFFADVLKLRLEGYGPDYDHGFLPLDDTDFISRHYFFCVEENGGYRPVGGFRQVSLARCDEYGIEIPLYKLMKALNAHPHAELLRDIIDGHRKRRETLIYSSALTIAKAHRRDRALANLVLELVPALTYCDILDERVVTTIGASALRFKTNAVFERWGYRALEQNGVPLEAVHRPAAAADDYVLCMMLREASAYTKECYFKHQKLIRASMRIAPTAEPGAERRQAA
jgi:hypothetical protein